MRAQRRHLVAFLTLLCGASGALAQPAPSLGSADSFVILAGTRVVNSGPTRVTGSVGVSSAAGASGLPPGVPSPGAIFVNDSTVRRAQQANAAAYENLAGRPCGTAGLIHVQCFEPDATLAGPLTLAGTRDEVWIFKIPGTLTVERDATIVLEGEANSSHIFWVVGDWAMLGTNSAFAGTILARNDITFGRGATIAGRALSQHGAVTLDADAVNLCGKLVTLSPRVLPTGTVGMRYQATPPITADGGDPRYELEIIAGALPPGLSADLSGTPREAGTFVFEVLATDSRGAMGVRVYEIVICPQVPLPPPLPPGNVCDPYSVAYPFPITGLPPGLVQTDGVVAGVPSLAGDFPLVVRNGVDDCSVTVKHVLTIGCNVKIVASLPKGKACTPYCGTLTPSCPGKFTVVSEPLPPGLSSANGVICGVPKTPGTYPLTVHIETESGCSLDGAYSIVIEPPDPPPTITINGTVCVPVDLPADGTFVPPLPPDRIFRTRGTFPFTLIRNDPSLCPREQKYKIEIACPTTILPPNLPQIVPFYKQLDIDVRRADLSACFTYEVDPTTLPHNTFFANGRIQGPPDTLEKTKIKVTATDPVSGCVVTEIYPLEIVDPPLCEAAIVLSPPPMKLTGGTVGVAYPPRVFTASGGAAPYAYDVLLPPPPGLQLSLAGVLTGIPTMAGRFNFAVRATDATGTPGCPQVYTIEIGN